MNERMPDLGDVVYVVRHAHAGRRSPAPDDDLRPLSGHGRRQAEQISEVLVPLASGTILSSPYARCVETVTPLARRLRVDLDIRSELAEGTPVDPVVRLLAELPAGSIVCVHGDMLVALVDRLATGDRDHAPISFEKGVVWALAHDEGRCVDIRPLHVPDATR